MSSRRVLIFTGGSIKRDSIHEIKEGDFIIGADKGALFLVDSGIQPDISVGDFDSVTEDELEKIRRFSHKMITCDPVDKDLTDTELAFDIALDQQPDEIMMHGAVGSRLDHSLANIQMMLRGLQHKVACSIMDEHNYISLTGSTLQVQDRGFSYVSLLPLTPEVTGITLSGFMYPLHNASIHMGQSLGISNKLTGPEGTIRIDSGLLLVIQSKD
ncbi:thiamine diphosphokinase [Paenibacillus sp. YPG26]|uniref:thiamine diphosphokinase n=1 Tax=Paenibacillus sp. YPG26 TaxID=2878915 RepID=UPI00203BB23A|nr:thiamine diphosphokinase [Paenibacillus sp. YPG26]USB34920.1 thiamine diphosphokinase [Paenibacillus sp. YPG26]